ncbi:MAG: cobalamin-dependent protein [Candidatus Omnitrophota bacterium]
MKKILFVRCPKHMWPWVNESDNFLLPLGLPILAAAIREKIKNRVEVKIIDCPPLKIGWKSLADLIKKENPDFVGAGEEALYQHEAIRLFELTKQINPRIINIAGGHYFSWMVEDSLKNYPIDIIVKFEAEETIVELLEALLEKKDLAAVKGIAFKKDGRVITTPPRPIICNLDLIPIPAYDLMPMRKYGDKAIFWPESATIEGSRGCIDTCSYCSLWTFWGKHNDTDNKQDKIGATPFYRQKSVGRVMQEIEILYEKYNRRLLLWADPTFNVNPAWTEELCDEILKRNYKLEHWVFLRTDFALRDAKSGLLDKMVRAGIVHPLFGVERATADEWEKLSKHGQKSDEIKELFHLMRDKYPQVFRQATFVTCLPFDNEKTMMDLAKYAVEIDCDFPVFHPVTPVPGTYLYEEVIAKEYLEEKDLKEAYWEYPLLKNIHGLSRTDLARLNRKAQLYCILGNFKTMLKGVFSKYPSKRFRYREVLRVLFLKSFQMLSLKIKEIFFKPTDLEKKIPQSLFFIMEKPKWYDK